MDHPPVPLTIQVEAFPLTDPLAVVSDTTLSSTGATLDDVITVGLRELRQDASELVRRVEGGEQIEITVSGRLAARLVPASSKRWQSWDDIASAFAGRPDPTWDHDRDLIEGSVIDPWEPRS